MPEYDDALQVINGWRGAHYYPLNTFKVTLRRKALEVDPDRIVAQRIKRLSSIELKLERFPNMRFSQMQDIGGCRAIVATTANVRKLMKKYETSDLKHKLDDVDDYILKPKDSGYRGVHLIYSYYSDKKAPSAWNGLNIEMQLRSRLQHAWATAVEIVGTFLSQSLKSSQGEERWLRFFALMGSALARREGSENLVPDTPNSVAALKTELRKSVGELNVRDVLQMYQNGIEVGLQGAASGDYYFLLRLEPSVGRMNVTGFKRHDIDRATEEYLRVERQISGTPGSEAVLVSVDSLAVLRRAYPNYFLDTQAFLEEVSEAIRR